MEGILGRKLGMTQIYVEDGTAIPVTVIQAGPCLVVQRKTAETDGYEAVQIGLVEEKPAKVNQPQGGHFKKAGVAPVRRVEEFRVAATATTTQGGRRGESHDLRREGVGGRRRHEQGQGLSGRHEASWLPRRPGSPRLDVPPRAGLHRLVGLPVPGLPRHAGDRPDGRRAGDGEEPADRQDRRRAEPDLRARRRARLQDRVPGDPAGEAGLDAP